jgi:WD40 repeat protein
MLSLTSPEGGERGKRAVKEQVFGACVTSLQLVSGEPVAALGDGRIVFLKSDAIVEAHTGAILCAVPSSDGLALISGGDDGRLCLTRKDRTEILFEGPKWIDAVASHKSGGYAFAHGRNLTLIGPEGRSQACQMNGNVSAITAMHTGYAVAHCDGVTLVTVDGDGPLHVELMHSVGGHIAISASPDGIFLVTGTLDKSLNCWRLSDRVSSSMGGYSTKAQSLAWAGKGNWLVSSGETRIILWPMRGTAGIGAKRPVMLAPGSSPVTAVACHSSKDVLAAGYRDGRVVLARRRVRVVHPVRQGDGEEITALMIDERCERLVYGTASGVVGLASLRSFL